MDAGSPTPVLPAGLPEDWALDHDVTCPSCRYNLRMLRTPRCPECGLVFRWQTLLRVQCPRCNEELFSTDSAECPRCRLHLDWARLLEANAQVDRKLFEYSDRPVRAAFRTWIAILNPWRFWRSIPLESPPAIGRLRRLRWMAVLVCLVGLTLLASLNGEIPRNWFDRCIGNIKYGASHDVLYPFNVVLVLPLVTALGLPLFTPTLLRFQVRRDQLRRCLAYATLGLFWIGILFVLGFLYAVYINTASMGTLWLTDLVRPGTLDPYDLFDFVYGGWGRFNHPTKFRFNVAVAAITLFFGFVWWWAFLYVGVRHCLRLDRRNTAALLLSTQFIGLLLIVISSPNLTTALAVLSIRLEDLLS